VCYFDGLSLYLLAKSPSETVEQARELYAGREDDTRTAFRGLARNWQDLGELDTTGWRDMAAWDFLSQTICIIADSRPEERGWRTAWDEIARRLRELSPEEDTLAVLEKLRERRNLLSGTSPPIPAVRPMEPEVGAGAPRSQVKEGQKKGKGGKPPLEKSSPLKFQVYQRIQQEHQPGNKYLDTVDRLKADRQFAEQVKEASLKLDSKLVRKALAFFDRRKRAQAGKNQETDPA
jgi:hypothetical protein